MRQPRDEAMQVMRYCAELGRNIHKDYLFGEDPQVQIGTLALLAGYFVHQFDKDCHEQVLADLNDGIRFALKAQLKRSDEEAGR